MFRRKNSRAAAHAANAPPTSSAASTAAMQAFLASRASSSNLSSAAAAAALRSHTASPTNPATIQTKRMQRRLSNSSNGSAAGGPQLKRQGSSGSMTERTFRDASPLRSTSPSVNHPPIPPIPKNLPNRNKGPIARPSSAEPPRRVASPLPNGPSGRGISLDRGNVKPKNEAVPPMPKPRLAKIDTLAAETPPKRASVNFSRPMSPAQGTPPASPLPRANGQVAKPDSKIITADDVDNITYSLENQATAPVKKKKKRIATEVVEGSHLAKGHTAGKPTGSAVEKVGKNPEQADASNGKMSAASASVSTASEEPQAVAPKATRPTKLSKRPSVVKEDADGESMAEKGIDTPAKKQNGSAISKPTQTPQYKALLQSDITPKSTQVLTPSSTDTQQRRASLSPSRTARFSSQPVYDLSAGPKHEPPARAISPAKSALKNSPSRGPSPAMLNYEISDNASNASDEGKKKRKSVRVSFEEGPIAVGEAAGSDPGRSPLVFSPQHKDPAGRQQFNFRSKLDEEEADEKISPIPTLPSFGSIRGRKDQHRDNTHQALYGDEQVRKNLADMTSSSDHAIGSIVAQHAAVARSTTEPAAPIVTSVEGSGETSDLDDSDEEGLSKGNNKFPDLVPTSTENKLRSPVETAHGKQPEETVPVIAVLPATPGNDTKDSRDSWLSGMPGSFGPNDSPEKPGTVDSASTSGTVTPRRESVVEPQPAQAQREHISATPTVGMIAESLRREEDDNLTEDSGDSVYGDAAEDPIDDEGDGFGSINAIVDSPVVSPVAKPASGGQRADDESPSPTERTKTTTDRGVAQKYPSGVNAIEKPQAAPEAKGVGVAVSDTPEVAKQSEIVPQMQEPAIPPKAAARKTKKTPVDTVVAPSPSAQTAKPASHQAPAPKKSALKKTVRSSSQEVAPTEAIPPMRKTMRGPQPVAASRPAPRRREDSDASLPSVPIRRTQPVSSSATNIPNTKKPLSKPNGITQVNGTPNRSSVVSKPSPAVSAPRSAPPKLSRTMSNDSDSESSFKRERRQRPQREGAYSMKRSMRDSRPVPGPPPIPRDTTSAMRNRPVSMSGVSLRTSMRDGAKPPSRPSSVRVASPSGSFFGRRKKVEEKPSFSRKFSDDSLDERPAVFRSKYADSSDEEDIATDLPPVRGIPRRIEEEDSTDLEDSDDESKSRPTATKVSTPATTTSALASKSMRTPASPTTPAVTNLAVLSTPEKKKRSFFGVLGRKKDKSSSKIGKSELDSPARRDTPLERTKLERGDIRSATPEPPTPLETPLGSPPGSPSSPLVRPGKLQRRSTSQRTTSESWPLPPPIPADVTIPVRPTTSDGSPARPALGSRQISSGTSYADGVALGRSGKKKRFPMLRKAFGLHD